MRASSTALATPAQAASSAALSATAESLAPPSSASRFGAIRPPVPGRAIATCSMTPPPATFNGRTPDPTNRCGQPPVRVSDEPIATRFRSNRHPGASTLNDPDRKR